MINVCIFEDEIFKQLEPLTYVRPSYELLLGTDTLLDKFLRYYDKRFITLHVRKELLATVKERYKKFPVNRINLSSSCLFLNGRLIINNEIVNLLNLNQNQFNTLYTFQNQIVAMHLKEDVLEGIIPSLSDFVDNRTLIKLLRDKCVCKELDDVNLVTQLWDLIEYNPQAIIDDFKHKNLLGIIKGDVHPFATLYNENNIFIDKLSTIQNFAVLNAEEGPIYIDKNVTIESGSYIKGPAFIGKNSHIFNARVTESSIGSNCKIGGEVSKSVFYKYSNKAHYGYIGNSYIGEWVNLGAGSTTSNLKNNYGTISMINSENQQINTKLQFLGSFIGDHCKIGIQSKLLAGTSIGFGSSVTNTTFIPKFLHHFSWSTDHTIEKYDLNKFIEMIEKVMSRRNKQLNESLQNLITSKYMASKNIAPTYK